MLDAAVAVALDEHNRDTLAACGRYWCVAQTHPQAERWAAAGLTRKGYVVYLPLCTVTRPDRATPTIRHRVQVPLWPGYLLLSLNHGEPWTPARYTQGILRLLMSGNQLHHINAGVVEAVQGALALSASGILADVSWAPGTPCSLATGAFHGLPGVVLAVHGNMAHISLMFLGQLRQLTVETGCLIPRDS